MAFGFNEKDVKRISETVRYFENDPYGRLDKATAPRPVVDIARFAKTSSTISASTGTTPNITPGSGTVRTYDYNRDTNKLAVSDDTYWVKNIWTDTVAASKNCEIVWRDGHWWIWNWSC